jgi:tape measure domain-containing protein
MSDLNAKIVVSMTDQASSPLTRLLSTLDRMDSTVGKLSASMSEFSSKMAKTNEEAKAAPSLWDRFSGSLSAIGQRAGGAKQSLVDLGSSVKTLGVSMAAITGGGAYLLKTHFVDVASQFETFGAQMRQFYGDDGPKMMAWVSDFAAKTPTDVAGVMDAFIQLKNYGIDPTDGSLMSLVDATSKAGFSQEKLLGVVRGVGQAWTKTKLQGEEVNQLLERGIPVWSILSKEMGKPIPVIMKMSEAGKIGRKEMSLLIKAIGRDSLGASAGQMKTWSGLVSNLGDSWTQFKLAIMNAGPFDFLKSRLQGLLATIEQMSKSGELASLAKSIGGSVADAFKSVWDNRQKIVDTFTDIKRSFMGAVEFVGGFKNAAIIAGVALNAGLIVNLVKATYAVTSFGWALAANPVGVAVIGIAALGAAVYLLWKNWDLVFSSIGRKWDEFMALSTRAKVVVVWAFTAMMVPLLPFTAFLTPVIGGIVLLARVARWVTNGWEPVDRFFRGLWTGLSNGFDVAIKKITALIDIVSNSKIGKVLDIATKPIQLGIGIAKAGAGAVGTAADYYGGAFKEAGQGLGIMAKPLSAADAYGVNAIAMSNSQKILSSAGGFVPAPALNITGSTGNPLAQYGIGPGSKLGNIDVNVNLETGKATVTPTAGKALDLAVSVGTGVSGYPVGVL